MKELNKKNKVIIGFLFGVAFSLIIAGVLVQNFANLEDELKEEISSLAKLDITKDKYDMSIKTWGDYAVVERKIKTYLNEYAEGIQKVLKITNDEQFNSLLSVSNLKADGPNFSKSRSYIDENKETFNKEIDELIANCDDEKIEEDIKESLVDAYYISLYKELLLEDDMKNDILASEELLKETKRKVNLIFDVSLKVYDLLEKHPDEWTIEDEQIKFKTVDLLNQYNSYVLQIQ